MNLFFLPADKHQKFLQIDAIILGVCVARHAQITQNSKFAISLQYPKKEVSSEVDFLHVYKHESCLQIDAMMGMAKHSENNMFAMSLQYLKKEFREEFDFLHADKHQFLAS